MRATVNLEFGSEEIESFMTGVIVKSVAGSLGEIAGDPMALQGLLAGMQQAIGMVLNHAAVSMHHHGPPRARPGGPYPMGYGAPMGPPSAYPVGTTGPGPQGPSNVRPIAEPATVEHCFVIDETNQNEVSWGCCRCAIPNGLHRTHCRRCNHQRCGAVVTPSPEQQPLPQMPEGPPP
jgi:hypothetical protein